MKSLLDKMFPSSIDAITPMVRREREMYREEKDNADRRLALLRRLEWIPDANCIRKYDWCPDCDQLRGQGHTDGCELDAECNG